MNLARLSVKSGLLLGMVAAAVAAGPARADLIAAYDHPTASNGMDIGLVDLSTGSQLAVPPGVNLGGNETHPELSGDGSILVFQRGSLIVRYDLRHNTSTTIAPPFGADGFTTPGISPDGTRVIYGQGSIDVSNNRTSIASGKASVFVASTLETSVPPIPTLAPTDPSPACALGGVQGYPGRGTVDASIDNGANPIMAWSTSEFPSYFIEVMQFTGAHFTGCLQQLGVVSGDLNRAHATARFGGITYPGSGQQSTSFDLHTFVPGRGDASFPVGASTDPAAINSPAAEDLPSWSSDGRYLGFVRSASSTVIEVYDEQSQRLVNPSGINVGFVDTSVTGNLSIALDPTIFHIVCNRINTFNQICVQSSAGPTGALIMRIVGKHRIPTVLGGKLRVRTVPRLRQVGIVVLGRKARHFHVRLSDLRVHGKPLARGHYLIFIRARTKSLKLVRDISQAIPFTIK
jgi:hypothetical protein